MVKKYLLYILFFNMNVWRLESLSNIYYLLKKMQLFGKNLRLGTPLKRIPRIEMEALKKDSFEK